MTDVPRRTGTSFRVLRHRDFAFLWCGSLVSATGSWMQNVTVPFVVYQMTGSTTWLGIAGLSFVGTAVGGPIGGSLADRYSRRRIILVTLVILGCCASALWLVWSTGVATPGIIVAIVFVAGTVAGVNVTAWQAYIVTLVDADELADAVRLNSTQFTAARAFGPAIAALVLETLGASAAFLLNALSFVVIISAVLAVRSRPHARSPHTSSLAAEFRDGLRFIRHRRSLVLPIVMIGIGSMLGTSAVQLAPALAEDLFHVGRGGYGLLVAAFGFGAVLGVVTVAIVADRAVESALARNGVIALAFSVVLLGSAPTYGIGVAAMFAMGVAYMVFSTSLATAVQSRVDDAYRGRVVSIYFASLLVGVPIGALLQGLLASFVGLRSVVVAAGVLLLILACSVIIRYDRLRMLDRSGAEETTEHPREALGLQVRAQTVEDLDRG